MSEESRTAIIIAVITLFSSLTGTVLGGKFNEWQAERQGLFDQKRAILEHRMKLFESFSVIINSASKALALQRRLDIDRDISLQCSAPPKKGGISPELCKQKLSIDSSLSMHQEQVKLSAEFFSTLQMAALYFGPNTKKAISAVPSNPQWWAVDESIFINVLTAMSDELTYFPS